MLKVENTVNSCRKMRVILRKNGFKGNERGSGKSHGYGYNRKSRLWSADAIQSLANHGKPNRVEDGTVRHS